MTVSANIGFGPKVAGEIVVLGKPGEVVESYQINSSCRGKIIIFLSYTPRELLEKAGLVGVRGILVPSIHFRDYDYFEKADDFSLLVLTKFGKLDIDSETATKLSKLSGKRGILSGEGKNLEI